MSTDNLFVIIMFAGVYFSALLLLDGAHRSHIAELHRIHREQVAGLRSYIRTLSRERMWLESVVAQQKEKLAQQQEQQREEAKADVRWMPEHIQWLPPSEEYDSSEE